MAGGTALCLALVGAGGPPAAGAPAAPTPTGTSTVADQPTRSILIFHQTGPFLRHASIEYGIAALEEMGRERGFTVEETQRSDAFTDANLARFDAVVWLNAIGVVLDDAQKAAFERYVRGGGGYAGVHGPGGMETNWPWFYNDLMGSFYHSHPAQPEHPETQRAVIRVEDDRHPSTRTLPREWVFAEEWWNFYHSPRADVHVLASLDESSYDPGAGPMGDHPVTWCRAVDGGRSWYTNLGHSVGSYADEDFRAHLLGGVSYVAGWEAGDCSGDARDPDAAFARVPLADGADAGGPPAALAVLPDRGVLHASRDGEIRLTTPAGRTSRAARLKVYDHRDSGLYALAVAPDFARSRAVYVYYSPRLGTPSGDAPARADRATLARYQGHDRVSRFTLRRDGTLDLAREQVVLRVPTDRGHCCHAGGDLGFDPAGNLLVSTSDDTDPSRSGGYAPLDERPDVSPTYDAQRTSANTADLRGKLLRITPVGNGGYRIPAGNLFRPGTPRTRPEIYAMGLRDPRRFSVDPATGWVHLGDHAPGAAVADPQRGPAGKAEFNLVKGPGNYGWPYCVGRNEAYRDHDFATGRSGPAFDCAAPRNTSPRNTGLTALPPAQPAWIAYQGESEAAFTTGGSQPPFGNGGAAPMGGPTYRYDPASRSAGRFPARYDGSTFAYERDRAWIKEIRDGETRPFGRALDLRQPVDLEFGPDGALYVLDRDDYGPAADGWALYRVEYAAGRGAPRAAVRAEDPSGPVGRVVTFHPAGTYDPDGDRLRYAWDFDGDGRTDSTASGAVTHRYQRAGSYRATLTVTDPTGRSDTARVTVTVGNTAPTVRLVTPAQGGVAAPGARIRFEVAVSDPEDATVDCSRVTVRYTAPDGQTQARATGCTGTLVVGGSATDAGTVSASYTDSGAPGAPRLTGVDQRVVQPARREAESVREAFGVRVVPHAAASGGAVIGDVDPTDFVKIDPTELTGVEGITLRVSSSGPGGRVVVQNHEVGGPTLAVIEVPDTGGTDRFVQLPATPLAASVGTEPLYLVFDGPAGVFTVDTVAFTGPGLAG
ncbi:ThuA domain-containing protein [Micromonospora sp. WMMD882]|uniref:ThuA domain-containing protein n=1 Tax=Micromonospora sp. WMMD882 TaxID=3015151 RepID=UPI00248CCBD8|nr:ThuA domain-containing protein [Micromonospora sp. WMMD882]WBB78701.1 ThuA domain-containing protein [Micromonospora sp. WMMD882]